MKPYLCKACDVETIQIGTNPDEMICEQCGGCDWSERELPEINIHQYNAISKDFRGVCTVERYDLPGWEEERLFYLGKRTMMSGDGRCSLLFEGLHFQIVDEPLIYRGWNLTYSANQWQAEQHDVILSSHSESSVKRLVDEQLETYCEGRR